MAAAPAEKRRQRRRSAALAASIALAGAIVIAGGSAVPALASPACTRANGILLPAPVGNVDPLAAPQLKLRPDRLRKSTVPGRVNDREDVRVALGPTGLPASVTDTQHLAIHGAGNYIVRELGPAREAVGLGSTVPPVLELGTVVWQGFSPGTRTLAARLTLDPGIEAARLPMSVKFEFRDRSGQVRPLAPGAAAPAAGTVTISLANNTASTRVVAAGTGEIAALAAALDRLRAAAGRPAAAVPPTAGAGLPTCLPGRTSGALSLNVVSPLRVTGTLNAPGGSAAISGPGLTPVAGGAHIAGTLNAAADFAVKVAPGDHIGMQLDVRPWLDPRTLTPPQSAHTWRQWAHSNPTTKAAAAATQTLVSAAATAARSAEYSPYLQADAPGPDLSTFTYVIAPAPRAIRVARDVQPRPGGIAAAAVAVLAILGNAALLHRRL